MRIQSGRSMIEMLGVLALVGILSIGGIMMYRRAVNNYHANTILDDVNRFAFVITEKGNYPLDSIIPKGDFKESGIYELEGYQDLGPQQFSITVRNVPYGVCDALLGKASVEYAVRVNVAGSSEKGELYNLFHTDLCHDNNDIVLYFGDTDDLFDFPECGRLPKCTKYSSDCKCIECESGYQLSANNSGKADGQYCVASSCKATNAGGCTSNADCCKSTDFCAFLSASDCIEVSGGVGTPTPTVGTCKNVTTYGTGTGSNTQTVNGVKFIRGTGLLKWWSAENWCERQKRNDGSPMALASAADLGCAYFPAHDKQGICNDSSTSGKEGDVLAALQMGGWTDSEFYWLSEGRPSNSCLAYRVAFDTGDIYYNSYRYYNRYALCH